MPVKMILTKMNYKPELGVILTHNLDPHMRALIEAEGQASEHGPSAFIVFYANDPQAFAEGVTFADANRTAEAIIWVLYPKQTAKGYKSSINRDDILKLAPEHGYTPVRQVAFDDDLSALRLKRI